MTSSSRRYALHIVVARLLHLGVKIGTGRKVVGLHACHRTTVRGDIRRLSPFGGSRPAPPWQAG